MTRIFAIIVSLLFIAGCGFQPIYATGGNAQLAEKLQSVELQQNAGKYGQQLENAIADRINPTSVPSPMGQLYQLKFDFKQTKSAAIVEQDGIIPRYHVNLVSRYQLVDLVSGETLSQGTVRRVASYNVADEKFAAYVAEKEAIDRALIEMSVDFQQRLAAYFAS